jgi:enoyl-CoA hydratase/carnithine racemase
MLRLERRNDIALLTLAHGKANAFDLELCEALIERFAECRATPYSAVVVTGQGSIFSAGVDLLRVLNDGPAYVSTFLPALSDALETVFTFPKPLVAAINGHAIAGGCILACAADRRLMARGETRIGVPELAVGVPFPPVPLEIVRFAIPPQRAQELLLGGATLKPGAAERFGLVDTVEEPDALLDAAIAAAEAFASRPAAAFAMTKAQLRAPAVERMRSGRARWDHEVTALWTAPETFDAIRRYIDRTFRRG